MMNNTYKRGFTLIELLVVIAIIGILASVVLASLNTARDKGSDAAAKGAMSQLRAQAELFYDVGRTYDVFCTTSGVGGTYGGTQILANALANSYAPSTATSVVCNDDPTAYAAAVDLKSKGGAGTRYWCVDSTGFADLRTTALGTATVCPAS